MIFACEDMWFRVIRYRVLPDFVSIVCAMDPLGDDTMSWRIRRYLDRLEVVKLDVLTV